MGDTVRGKKRKVLRERMTQTENGDYYWCAICAPKDPSSVSTTVTRRSTAMTNGRSETKLFCNFRELREHLFEHHWEQQILIFEEDKNDSVRNSNVCPNLDCKLKFRNPQQMRVHFFDSHKSLYEEAKGENLGNRIPSHTEWCDFMDRFCFECFFVGNCYKTNLLHKYIEHVDFMMDFIKRNNLVLTGIFQRCSSQRNGRSTSGDISDDSKGQTKEYVYHPETKTNSALKEDVHPSKSKGSKKANTVSAQNFDPKKSVEPPQTESPIQMKTNPTKNSCQKLPLVLSQSPELENPNKKKATKKVRKISETITKVEPKKNVAKKAGKISETIRSVKSAGKKNVSKEAGKIPETFRSVKIEVSPKKSKPLRNKNVNPQKQNDLILSLDGLDDKRDEMQITPSVCHTNGNSEATAILSPFNAESDSTNLDEWEIGIDPKNPSTRNECKICLAPFWKASDNAEKRKLSVGRHLARTHFGMSIKMSFVLNQIEKGQETFQTNECLVCSAKFKGYPFVSDHFASKHVCLEKIYNEFLTLKNLKKHAFEETCETTHDFDDVPLEDCFSLARAMRPETQIRLFQLLSHDQIIIQPGPCFLICKELQRCHECEKHFIVRNSADDNFCCQFAGIRKLRVTLDSGTKSPCLFSFKPEGFLDPETNPCQKDLEIWKFVDTFLHPELDSATSEFILKMTFPQFCQMIRSEVEARKNYTGVVIWRRLQEKFREMCDVCKTTIFNYHWTCADCGFFACLDCTNTRSGNTQLQHRSDFSESEEPPTKRFRSLRDLEANLDEEFWPFCREGIRHNPQKMMLTQIIPGQWLEKMWEQSHEIFDKLETDVVCSCRQSNKDEDMDVSTLIETVNNLDPDFQNDDGFSRLDLMEDFLTCNVCQDVVSSKMFDRHRLSHFAKTTKNQVVFEKSESKAQSGGNHSSEGFAQMLRGHLQINSRVPESKSAFSVKGSQPENNSRLQKQNTVSATIDVFPEVPHSWLCEGRLLLLHDPTFPKNVELFHNHWLRGQPVLVSNSSRHLDKKLWHPRAFLKDFGHLHHDLINCLTGKLVPQASLKKFWMGFEEIKHRFTDHRGAPMLLKLKDWPPSEDIAEFMPKRFKNLFDSFPLPDYTKREGVRNLAAFLPSYCLKPELGPKLYIAYGSAQHSDKASTNLHLDMSDAVNCLVYVSSPIDVDPVKEAEGVLREIEESGCDILMRERCVKELPGALWHIYHPSDTVKIRDFLNKIALGKNKRLDPHDDPIHDQSTYLDSELRRQLLMEYGVRGYAIVQCAGDTVFIPAGACHQVRNLHGCIKVAEDFVSPENIQHCLHLTQEFRHLTEMHTNHEDKLQMKSILYHAVKSAVTVLMKTGKAS